MLGTWPQKSHSVTRAVFPSVTAVTSPTEIQGECKKLIPIGRVKTMWDGNYMSRRAIFGKHNLPFWVWETALLSIKNHMNDVADTEAFHLCAVSHI